jgi:hypothetical protein
MVQIIKNDIFLYLNSWNKKSRIYYIISIIIKSKYISNNIYRNYNIELSSNLFLKQFSIDEFFNRNINNNLNIIYI